MTRAEIRERTLTRLIGGGSMWWYVLDVDGIRVLGAAQEDDRVGMARLRELVRARK
jgi:hypothetical protein